MMEWRRLAATLGLAQMGLAQMGLAQRGPAQMRTARMRMILRPWMMTFTCRSACLQASGSASHVPLTVATCLLQEPSGTPIPQSQRDGGSFAPAQVTDIILQVEGFAQPGGTCLGWGSCASCSLCLSWPAEANGHPPKKRARHGDKEEAFAAKALVDFR